MNVIQKTTGIAILSVEMMKFKIQHFLKSNEFHKKCREEQYLRHRRNKEYVERFLESMKNSKN